eukprot:Em0114g13a
MHPRNYYKENKPDFGKLAEARPSLKPFLLPSPSTTHAYTLDFSDRDALRELTCALLECDFGLRVELPVGKLVPTLTLRLNYIHWVEDLISCVSGKIPTGDSVLGVDIGTGASCIYPLLGSKLNGWRFLATEIDKDSVTYALSNVQRNSMDTKIKVVQVSGDTLLLGALEDQQYHFCMCNPPFFGDGEERYGGVARSGSRPVPSTVSTGDVCETITAGGEVEFVQRIIRDSLKLRTTVRTGKPTSNWLCQEVEDAQTDPWYLVKAVVDAFNECRETNLVPGSEVKMYDGAPVEENKHVRALRKRPLAQRDDSFVGEEDSTVHHLVPIPEYLRQYGKKKAKKWYTSMLGKKSSLSPLKAELRKLEVPVITTTEFVQGRTRRWAIAWSFDHSLKYKQDVGQGARKRPHPQEMALSNFPGTPEGLSEAVQWVQARFKELEVECSMVAQTSSCVELRCSATKDTWLNQRRKRRLLQQLERLEQQSSTGGPKNDGQDNLAQKQKIMEELASLHTPCHAEFLWSTALQETAASPVSKKGACQEVSPLGVVMRGEWLEGDDRDVVHQIMQYLTNSMAVH